MASRSLGTLTLDLVARIGGFTSGMTAAERAADKSLSAIEKRAYKFGQVLGQGLKVAAGAAVAGVTALAASLQLTINGLDDLNKSAQKVGVTTEELSKLAYAGELADVSLDALTSSLGRLTKAQAEALDTGSETAKVFEALGIAVKDADGNLRSSTEVLGDFADAFQNLGGSAEAQAAGFKIFGRSFQDLIPLLLEGKEGIQNAGEELERFGGVITTEAGRNADEFNDNLARLKNQFQAIFAQIATQLLPTLVELTQDLGKLAKNGDLAGKAVTLFSAAIELGIGALNLYAAAVDEVSVRIQFAVEAYKGWTEATKNFATLGFADGGVVEGFKKIGQAADDASAASKRLAEIRNRPSVPGVDEIDFTQGAPTSPDEQAAANRRLATALGGTTKAKQENTRATRELTQADQDWIDLQETFAAIEEETARFQTEKLIREGEIASQRDENFQQLISDLEFESSLIGKSADEQDRLNILRFAGIGLTKEQTEELEGAIAANEELRKVTEDQVAAQDAVRDSFKGFLNDLKEGVGLWDSLKNAADNFLDTLFQIVAQNLADSLFGQQGSTGGGATGDIFSSIFGALFGARATGGSVNSGGMYRVNEQGPELLTVGNRDYLMMGQGSGMVSPAVGGGVTINNSYINPQLNDWRSESQRRVEEATQFRVASSRNG